MFRVIDPAPVPDRLTVATTFPPTLSDKVPVRLPADFGVKRTHMLQELPTAKAEVQPFDARTKSPVMLGDNVMAEGVWLVIVTI